MLGEYGRAPLHKILQPLVNLLVRAHVTPNMITITGTILTVAAAVGLLIPGYFIIGPIVLGVILFADSLDGMVARTTGKVSQFGAFLDSTLDRIGDGAVFGSLAVWAFLHLEGVNLAVTASFAMIAVVLAPAVSYARAKAESLGVTKAKRGLAERTDRLAVSLWAVFFVGCGLPLWILQIGLGYVAFGCLFTVIQRILAAYRELN